MKKEMNLASILVCIVFVFLFCNIPRVFINCYEFLSSEEVIRFAINLNSKTLSRYTWLLFEQTELVFCLELGTFSLNYNHGLLFGQNTDNLCFIISKGFYVPLKGFVKAGQASGNMILTFREKRSMGESSQNGFSKFFIKHPTS